MRFQAGRTGKALAASFAAPGLLLLLNAGVAGAQEQEPAPAEESPPTCTASFTPQSIAVGEEAEIQVSFSEAVGEVGTIAVEKGSGLALDMETVLERQAKADQPQVEAGEARGDTAVVAEAYKQPQEGEVAAKEQVAKEEGIEFVEAFRGTEEAGLPVERGAEGGESVTLQFDATGANPGEWSLRFTGLKAQCTGEITVSN